MLARQLGDDARPMMPGPISGYFCSSAATSRRNSAVSRRDRLGGVHHDAQFVIGQRQRHDGSSPLVQILRRPWQRTGAAAHEQPRQAVREDVGCRVLAGLPKLHQLVAVAAPVFAHLVGDERRQIRAEAVAVAAVAWGVLDVTRQQFMASIGSDFQTRAFFYA
jgi:hypothetical protein